MSRGITAGGECDAWCTKCKRDSLHNIVAMDATGKTPAQVQCRSCQGTHKYRPPKDAPAPKAAKATAAKATGTKATGTKAASGKKSADKASSAPSAEALYKRWEGFVSQRAGTPEKAYAVTASFGANDVVKHSQFGLGFVVEEVAFNRVKVLFQDAERLLVVRHGQKPPAA